MIEKLIVAFFTKIEEKENISTKNGKAVFFIEELLVKKYGKINYIDKQKPTRLQKKYIDKDPKVSASLKDVFLKDVMAEYLGYEDYNDFKNNNETTDFISKIIKILKEKYKTMSVSTALVSGIAFFSYQTFVVETNNCIIWTGNIYETTSCTTTNAIDNSNASININSFKKIEINEDTMFFKNGKAIVWYGKNKQGEIEYFNSRGEHPETLKVLKKITPYILKKEGLLQEF